MPCEDCPDPLDLGDDPSLTDWYKGDFVNMMTPRIFEMTISVEVALPLDDASRLLDKARENGAESVAEETIGIIADLNDAQPLFRKVLRAYEANQRLLGFDFQISVRSEDVETTPINDSDSRD